jgi:hypothetical protein
VRGGPVRRRPTPQPLGSFGRLSARGHRSPVIGHLPGFHHASVVVYSELHARSPGTMFNLPSILKTSRSQGLVGRHLTRARRASPFRCVPLQHNQTALVGQHGHEHAHLACETDRARGSLGRSSWNSAGPPFVTFFSALASCTPSVFSRSPPAHMLTEFLCLIYLAISVLLAERWISSMASAELRAMAMYRVSSPLRRPHVHEGSCGSSAR